MAPHELPPVPEPRRELRITVSDRTASRAQRAHLVQRSEAVDVTVRVIPFHLEGFAGAASAMTYAGGGRCGA
ncbi:Scr1 family TA system antitoxin-like transcriptional regulator [Streptomyces sp. NK08204]|uniref:Scr1 family TA system antitoxin-like transcriptional regulator n=1 Tax=Streptomyces sp. NK08204 TaxID=2873260 RepID=UPI0035A89E44